MKIISTDFLRVSKIQPETLKSFLIQEVGLKSQDIVYNYLKDLNDSYPDFRNWFYSKVLNDILEKNNQREIIIALSELDSINIEEKYIITGIAILKKTCDEKKICTFRIHEDYRKLGIGKSLFEECFEYLETNKPIITISGDRREMFEPLISQFEFTLEQELKDYYKTGSVEYVYNGTL